MEQEYILRRPSDEYSEVRNQFTGISVPFRHVCEGNQMTDGLYPIQSSYSDLSEKYSQDSAYCSRYSSSASVVNPILRGSDVGLNSGRGPPVHDRFLSWTDFDQHAEELASPRTSRITSEEDVSKCARPLAERNYGRTAGMASQSCQDIHRQNEVFGHPRVSTNPGFDSDSRRAAKTNSFSAFQSQPTGLSSPAYLLQRNDKSSRPRSVNDRCHKVDASPVGSQLSYSSMTQTGPVKPRGKLPPADKHWLDARNPESRGVVFPSGSSSGDSRSPLSPRQSSQGFAVGSLSENFSETENSQYTFGPGREDARHFTGSQDIGCVSDTDASRGGGDIQDSNETSMLRQLSRELYAQKLGIGLKGRKSFGGSRHPRLGSIDENSQSPATSNISPASHNPELYNMLSSEAEKHSKNPSGDFEGKALSPNSCPTFPRFSGICPSSEEPEKPGFIADDDLGDGCNFVRNRKCQMSLRKAFGIFDEFEISDGAVRNQPASTVQPLQKIIINSGECGPNSRPALDDHGPISARSKPSTGLQSRSSLTEVTRRKSSSMPRQQTVPFLSPEEDHGNKLPARSYADVDVLSGSHPSKCLQYNAEFPMAVGDGQQLDESCRFVKERCEAGKFGDLVHSPRPAPKPSSSHWSGSTWKDDTAEVGPAGSTTCCTASPPPPVLPPRRHRKGSAGDDRPSAGSAPGSAESYYSADADADEESTLKRDSYARQLRQHAHRVSRSGPLVASVSHSLHQPMPSLASDGGPDRASVAWQDPTARWSSISGSLLLSSNKCLGKSSPGEEVRYSDQTRTSAQCCEMDQSSKKSNGFQGMTSVDVPNVSRSSVTANTVSSVDFDQNCSISPNPGDELLPSSDFSRIKKHPRTPNESPGSYGVCTNQGVPVGAALLRAQNFRDDAKTVIDDRGVSYAPEAEDGVRYRPIVTAQKKKKKADLAVVQPNVRPTESSAAPEKRASSPPSVCETNAGPSPSRLGKVRGYPRPWKPPGEPAYDRAVAVPFEVKSNEEEVSFESSSRERPFVDAQPVEMENEPSRFSRSDRPVSSAGGRKQSDGKKHVTDAKADDKRVRFDSISSDRPRSFLRQQSPDQQRHSTETILSSEKQHKTAADYMTGLFTGTEEDGSTIHPDALTRNSFQRASLRSRLMTAKQTKNKTKTITLLHEDDTSLLEEQNVATSRNFCRNSENDMQDISKEEKLDLVAVLEKKLEGLREERQLLNDEIVENNALGKKVTAVVEQKLSMREFGKYRSYVDELEKVLCLTLKLSERLAKAENALLALPQNASDKEKTTLISKRDDLAEKHYDALLLKEGIDHRRDQVDGYLRNCLSRDELKDYEYFLKMKAQLVVDRQEVEDRVEMGRQQLELLKRTVTCNGGSRSGSYSCPKSDC